MDYTDFWNDWKNTTTIVFPEIIENEYFVNISLIFNDLWN